MKYETTKKIKKEDANWLNAVLNGPQREDYKRDGVIETITATFPNGFQMDVKVCNGDTPWIDAVLFNPNGIEIAVEQPSDGPIEGEYYLQDGEDEYILTIES
jgi:hypothetical protein